MRTPDALETHEQQAFVCWWRYQHPRVLIYAIPNGAHLAGDVAQRARQAGRMEREGLVAGIPDLHVPEMGLWFEFKRRRGGRLSDAQREVIKHLQSIGQVVIVAKGWTDAVEQFKGLRL